MKGTDYPLNDDQLRELIELQQHTTDPHIIQRVQATLLLLHDKKSLAEIMDALSCSRDFIYYWVQRYKMNGVQGLSGKSKHKVYGKIPEYLKDQILNFVNDITENGKYIYTYRGLKQALEKAGIIESISHEGVRQILKEYGFRFQSYDRGIKYYQNLESDAVQELDALINTTTSALVAQRAEIVLLALRDHCYVLDIADEFDTEASRVMKWVNKYLDHGIQGLFSSRVKKNCKLRRDALKEPIFALLQKPPPAGKKRWTNKLLAAHLEEQGIFINYNTVRKILRENGIDSLENI